MRQAVQNTLNSGSRLPAPSPWLPAPGSQLPAPHRRYQCAPFESSTSLRDPHRFQGRFPPQAQPYRTRSIPQSNSQLPTPNSQHPTPNTPIDVTNAPLSNLQHRSAIPIVFKVDFSTRPSRTETFNPTIQLPAPAPSSQHSQLPAPNSRPPTPIPRPPIDVTNAPLSNLQHRSAIPIVFKVVFSPQATGAEDIRPSPPCVTVGKVVSGRRVRPGALRPAPYAAAFAQRFVFRPHIPGCSSLRSPRRRSPAPPTGSIAPTSCSASSSVSTSDSSWSSFPGPTSGRSTASSSITRPSPIWSRAEPSAESSPGSGLLNLWIAISEAIHHKEN